MYWSNSSDTCPVTGHLAVQSLHSPARVSVVTHDCNQQIQHDHIAKERGRREGRDAAPAAVVQHRDVEVSEQGGEGPVRRRSRYM